MNTIRLNFPDKATALSTLYDKSVSELGTALVPKAGIHECDLIDVITRETGRTITVEGFEVPETEVVPGYHVNVEPTSADSISADLMAALEPYIVNPKNAYRVTANITTTQVEEQK